MAKEATKVKTCPKSGAPDGKGPEHPPLAYHANEGAWRCDQCDYREVGPPPVV